MTVGEISRRTCGTSRRTAAETAGNSDTVDANPSVAARRPRVFTPTQSSAQLPRSIERLPGEVVAEDIDTDFLVRRPENPGSPPQCHRPGYCRCSHSTYAFASLSACRRPGESGIQRAVYSRKHVTPSSFMTCMPFDLGVGLRASHATSFAAQAPAGIQHAARGIDNKDDVLAVDRDAGNGVLIGSAGNRVADVSCSSDNRCLAARNSPTSIVSSSSSLLALYWPRTLAQVACQARRTRFWTQSPQPSPSLSVAIQDGRESRELQTALAAARQSASFEILFGFFDHHRLVDLA